MSLSSEPKGSISVLVGVTNLAWFELTLSDVGH
jgi:hypothetical protein